MMALFGVFLQYIMLKLLKSSLFGMSSWRGEDGEDGGGDGLTGICSTLNPSTIDGRGQTLGNDGKT